MAVQLHEVFNTEAIALYMENAASNSIPFLGKALFPEKKKMGFDLKWLKTRKGLGVALKPSNFDAIPTVRPRGKAEMTQQQMPLFRESMVIKETDLEELGRLKDGNDPYLQPVVDSMYDDVNNLIEGAEISAERMRMQLLAPADGKMEITIGTADNMMYTYDYDTDDAWKKNNYLELSTGKWNTSEAKPLDDIRKAVQYLASVGVTATGIIGNSTTFGYLNDNDQVKSALISITGQTINFIDESTVAEVLRRKMGLNRFVYDKMYTDYDGTQKKFFPDNYVTIIGSGQLGSTWRGTTPEELTALGGVGVNIPMPPVDIRVLPSGIAVAIQSDYKPSLTVTTTASQIVLPSFEGMDSIFVIKVADDTE